MTSVYLVQYTEPTLIEKGAATPETLGIFTTYPLAWSCIETHAAKLGKALDLSCADMGAILLDDGLGDDWYMGGYTLEEFALDAIRELI